MPTKVVQQLYSFPAIETPLGRLHFGGNLCGWRGTGWQGFRRYGLYAVVLLKKGGGRYRDTRGADTRIQAGQVILVFPELPHQYGPEAGDVWEEVFLAFSGPAVESWRTFGLSPAFPILSPPDDCNPALAIGRILRSKINDEISMCRAMGSLHLLLATLNSHSERRGSEDGRLTKARQYLASPETGNDISKVAKQLGFHPDAFRRYFRDATGETPAAFRLRQRMARASALLRHPDLTLSNIAATLGFHDEFHFSKSFKKFTGFSPSQFRNRPLEDDEEILRFAPVEKETREMMVDS